MKLRRRRQLMASVAMLLAALPFLSLVHRYAGFQGETFVDIPKGTSTIETGRLLEQAGVIQFGWQALAVRALRPRVRLQAGEYRFAAPASAWEVIDRMVRGNVFYYELLVPEGSDMFAIAASLDRLGAPAATDFLQQAKDPSMIQDLDPQAPTLEGYLFPATYRITHHQTARSLCLEMTHLFRRTWKELGGGDAHTTVTLASLVEKETARGEERPLVASVFRNRLRVGLPLQCDPTVIYAAQLEGRYRGTIYRSDLESKDAYNTYTVAGLPPGPITNPGREALHAAMAPADTQYLYFVARPDGSGTHQFSKELAAHQRAVARYRHGNHKSNQAEPPRSLPRSRPAGGGRRARMARAAARNRTHL
jgi:UPF0755 protein